MHIYMCANPRTSGLQGGVLFIITVCLGLDNNG